MPLDLPLRCRCGRLRGIASDISPSGGLRFVCYCGDCQAFARFLDRADVLDAAGGTDIFHMPPGRVKLTAGTDSLRCLRLSNKVLRWYSECCRTPIANTPRSAGLPGHWHDSLLHGPRGAQSFSGRGAWSAALPHLRTLCRRASPAERNRSAVAWDFRPPRIKVARLVDARARSAHAGLRRSNEGSVHVAQYATLIAPYAVSGTPPW